MNEVELDAVLARGGAMWQEANTDVPHVDWDGIVAGRRRRRWCAAAGIAAGVAAALAVAIASTRGHHPVTSAARNEPSGSLGQFTSADARYGSPPRYFGLKRGGVYHRTVSSYGLNRTRPPITAIGGTQTGTAVYSVRPAPSCRTRLAVTSYTTNDLLHGRGIAIDGQAQPVSTIAGQPSATPLAISVPSGELAMVVTQPHGRLGTTTGRPCTGLQQIVFVNLRNGAVISRLRLADPQLRIDSLAWSADGQQLVYRLSPNTAEAARLTGATIAASGTHLVDIHSTPHALENNPSILPLTVSAGGFRYGPVFWWRGGFAATLNGSLYRVNERGTLGGLQATDFPDRVDSVASDVSGEHLLIGSGEVSYRWDFGRLAPLPGRFAEPSW